MNWKDYEIYITRHFQRLFPNASIQHDVRRLGVISRIERQIDILIEDTVAGFQLTIVIDCKYFQKKIDVKDVDEFLGYLHDLRASKGILITNHGYTDAAYNRAMYDTRDVEIRIIGINDLERYQSFIAIPYFGHHGVIISAPDGWIIDTVPPAPQIAALYPLGISREEAFHKDGYIYIMPSKKDDKWPTLDDLLKAQDDRVRNLHPGSRVDRVPINLRPDCNVVLRHLERPNVPNTIESTLFLDYPEIIIFFVLISPNEKHSIYLKKLLWVAEKLIKVNIMYDVMGHPLSIQRERN